MDEHEAERLARLLAEAETMESDFELLEPPLRWARMLSREELDLVHSHFARKYNIPLISP